MGLDFGVDEFGVVFALSTDPDGVGGVVGNVVDPVEDTEPLASDAMCRKYDLLLRMVAAPWRVKRAVLLTLFTTILKTASSLLFTESGCTPEIDIHHHNLMSLGSPGIPKKLVARKQDGLIGPVDIAHCPVCGWWFAVFPTEQAQLTSSYMGNQVSSSSLRKSHRIWNHALQKVTAYSVMSSHKLPISSMTREAEVAVLAVIRACKL